MDATLPIHSLRDVVASVADRSFGFNISPKWRCHIVPEVGPGQDGFTDDDDGNGTRMLQFFDAGIPVKAPHAHSQPVHQTCSDGLQFVSDPHWCNFPTPKIAFKTGWAGPGTEMENEELHQMVRGFDEVLDASKCVQIDLGDEGEAENQQQQQQPPKEVVVKPLDKPLTSDDVLNLQMFHRADASTHPQMPILAEQLLWPKCVASPNSLVCDNATRVSKKGAITWWHLDDCGEFVMQTGLRLSQDADKEGSRPSLLEEEKRTPVKLFIYGPPSTYDWFMHDAQSDKCQRIAALDILKAPCESLPPAESLPVVTVAILRAGGRPLISPPNIPHLVITLTDCVMVEQRRVALHFLHEVAYFAQKMQFWPSTPVVYKVLAEELQKEEKCVEFAGLLRALLLQSANSGGDASKKQEAMEKKIAAGKQAPPLIRRLVVRSLLSLCNSQLFRGATPKLMEMARDIFRECAALIGPHAVSAEAQTVKLYCDVMRAWPTPSATDSSSMQQQQQQQQHYQHGGVFWLNAFDGAATVKQYSAVLYFGGDSRPKQLLVKAEKKKNDDDKKKKEDGGGNEVAEQEECEDQTPNLPPGAWRLRNGVFPCYGPIRATQAQAEEDLRRVIARLASAACCEKKEPDELSVKDILDGFVVQDDLLDELF